MTAVENPRRGRKDKKALHKISLSFYTGTRPRLILTLLPSYIVRLTGAAANNTGATLGQNKNKKPELF